jgi:hypothetical protein
VPKIEALTMAEVDAGIRFWLASGWPTDFHDAAYRRFANENQDRFSAAWWDGFMEPALISWRALRGLRGFTRARLRANFEAHADDLRQLWSHLTEVIGAEAEIDGVEWEDVQPFTEVVAQLKPTTSPVLTSKFCHFQLPKVFPIVDNWAMGGSRSYAAHFALVKGVWAATTNRRRLVDRLRAEIGAKAYDGYPWTNKVVELGLIGRRQLARA